MWHGHLDANSEDGKATPVHLTKDDVITITVTGTAKNGPAAPEEGPDGDPNNQDPGAILPGTNVGAVLMRIGKDGELKKIGSGVSKHHFQEEGEVTFLYNDVPGEYGNNTGRFEVKLERDEAAEKPVAWSGTLDANDEDGVKTGVTVSKGEVISITVSGSEQIPGATDWVGPEGQPYYFPGQLLESENAGAVLMRIGGESNPYRLVGSKWSGAVEESGEITFVCNSDPEDYRNSRGSFEIKLRK